ncbi:helix-turn-helix transcriptional regulator [Jiangella mangrovi]|uniref:Putative DNA-binding transcriptional regulator YafY n=1 Tax=Jiangella mangrovi TaxID=1524084 RepID=A0A7W9GNB8_9ACTN|nr:WYL domain-containing protein [Jiangella mangrovi]MBB5787039.1 putative DNA-binding transcriptional regulator YafY [Jiangella mangrovi]
MPGGRDQLGPLERLTRLLLVLESAEPAGLPAARLVAVGRYGADSAYDAQRQLARDVTALTAIGWDIRNVAGPGVDAVYRLHARDTRLRVELAPEHQVELVRAALVAGDAGFRDRLGDLPEPGSDEAGLVRSGTPASAAPDPLTEAAYAVERRCLIHFTYKGRPRVVRPQLVRPGASGWYLYGHEIGSADTKWFVTDRMSDVSLDPPGTVGPLRDVTADQLNPITWNRDPRVDVTVETTAEHEPQVATMLGTPSARNVVFGDGDDDDGVRLTVPVTNRAAFRARLYELGRRARVVAPPEVVAEIVAELRRFVGPTAPERR